MSEVNLSYFIKKEEEGTIFAKVSKSRPGIGIGGYFDYSKYIGQTLDLTQTPGIDDTTVEDLGTAIRYCHYGDQLTVVSFSKIDCEKSKNFSAGDNFKPGCYDVNMVYIEDVKSFDDPNTINYFFEKLDKDDLINAGCATQTYHLERWGCSIGTEHWKRRFKELENK